MTPEQERIEVAQLREAVDAAGALLGELYRFTEVEPITNDGPLWDATWKLDDALRCLPKRTPNDPEEQQAR